MAVAARARETRTLDVWIVEDNDMLRDNLAQILNEQPDMHCALALDCCEDFVAALEAGGAPDLVLMDVGLPGASGIEGVTRASSLSPATKVIILTIHAEDQKVFEAICAGASGYLLKPSSPQQIVDAVRDVERGAAPINPYIARKMLSLFSRLSPPRPAEADYGLTAREKTILQLLVEGLTMEQCATRLDLSYHTIDNHLRNIYRKLHVHSRSKAVSKAIREELI
jgi:DNA-binding NarL/FixJ family response regulator